MNISGLLNTLNHADELTEHNNDDHDFGTVVNNNVRKIDEYAMILCADGKERRYRPAAN